MDVERWAQQGLLLLVRTYRLLLKPWLGNACRFEPTCSQYALDALQLHGPLRGGWLSGARLLRCHPWCASGCDPVPHPLAAAVSAAAADIDAVRASGRLGAQPRAEPPVKPFRIRPLP